MLSDVGEAFVVAGSLSHPLSSAGTGSDPTCPRAPQSTAGQSQSVPVTLQRPGTFPQMSSSLATLLKSGTALGEGLRGFAAPLQTLLSSFLQRVASLQPG